MKYFEYVIFCDKLPNRMTLHAVTTHFFDETDINKVNYKAEIEGRVIRIKTDYDRETEFRVTLKDERSDTMFDCRQTVKKEKETEDCFEVGDLVNITGTISYGIHITETNKRKCPIFKGRIEPGCKHKFRAAIEKSLGIEMVEKFSDSSFVRLPNEILNDKIQLNNQMNVHIVGVVKDPDIVNRICFSSFFQRKSYGFGRLDVYRPWGAEAAI